MPNNRKYLFYKNGQLSAEIGAGQNITLLLASDTPLAERSVGTTLLATNAQNSIIERSNCNDRKKLIYSVYGYSHTHFIMGFTGQRHDQLTNCYLLGNGYRTFSPQLMRFFSADSFSPHGPGGINSYVYCSGDPTNHVDPSGHILQKIWKKILKFKGHTKVVDHKKGHALMEVAREKEINRDEKAFRKSLKNPALLVDHARIATNVVHELHEFPDWHSHHLGGKHLKAAVRLVEAKADLKLTKIDPTGLMNDNDFLEYRTDVFNAEVNNLVSSLRATFPEGTLATSRRSSTTSVRSTATSYSFIE
ncbi:RHS repeat-associated core domain-containing protein [Pseudomonas sp. B14(2017)]|uniref:RHS repeat-associated core domain-containing protein n=1 Tax=Pseudomonas sp. B14(2017) TaxID=1981745 RepID=UPI000A1E957A|nr:RHS repeat-associated core domain-containing protein [Pseudomonas sp. B14(2017)]